MLPRMLELIQWCGQFTGLQLNLSKTLVYAPYIEKDGLVAGVTDTNRPVKYLGAYLGKDGDTQSFGVALLKIQKIV